MHFLWHLQKFFIAECGILYSTLFGKHSRATKLGQHKSDEYAQFELIYGKSKNHLEFTSVKTKKKILLYLPIENVLYRESFNKNDYIALTK